MSLFGAFMHQCVKLTPAIIAENYDSPKKASQTT